MFATKTFFVCCIIILLVSPIEAGIFSRDRPSNLESGERDGMGGLGGMRTTTRQSRTKSVLKKVAIGAGIAALAGGAYYAYKHG
uniref:Uncharacterized protein n=1 Tax=Panagrolaimus sp. PS1159 TaxID=55785 RepID=A0AC35FU97_9BILA